MTSVIGFGAPKKAGTKTAHGEPLGEEEIRGAKRAYGWPEDSSFLVPDGVYEHFAAGIGKRGATGRAAWLKLVAGYKADYPELAAELEMMNQHTLPDGWDANIPVFPADAKGLASRDSSQKVLNAIAPHVPWMIGGAADLAPSTKSNMTFAGADSFEADNYGGRNLHFGIREHAMGSICNGLALSALRPYGSGFLIFSDYMKPPIRLSAIMELPVIYIFTHDSIGVGEDGPTHQPIETTRLTARGARHAGDTAGRCQRGGGGVASYRDTQGASGLSGPVAPAAAHAGPREIRIRVRREARRLRAGRSAGRG